MAGCFLGLGGGHQVGDAGSADLLCVPADVSLMVEQVEAALIGIMLSVGWQLVKG